MQLWLLIGDIILWVCVIVLHAVRLKPCELSPFELKRRATSGDTSAKEMAERERLLPRIGSIRRILESVLLVLAVALTIVLFGWIVGTIIASIASFLVSTVARVSFISRTAEKLYSPREAELLRLVRDWRWLDWLQGVTEQGSESAATSKYELTYLIERSSGVLTSDELLRLKASLNLDSRRVADVMTPASVIETADVHDSLGPLVLDDLHKTGHSRFPVIDTDIHHVVGVLYLHDIINLRSAKPSVKEAMDPRVHYIHENQSLERALHGFLRTHRHFFVVVNDHRETVGVLTLEDVIESLLGKKIVDEFDQYEDLRAVAESNPHKNNLPKGKTDI